MERIGLIAAMASESQALVRRIKTYHRVAVGKYRDVAFQVGDRECVLVISGMGIRKAADAARRLIEAYHPQCLLSFGIAGAVRPDLRIGDVVMAARNGTLENGTVVESQPLARLSEKSWQAVRQSLDEDGIRSYSGTAITTSGSQIVLLDEALPFPILEMETAGLIQVARENQVPLIVLRAISDNPQAPLPLDLAAVMDENSRLIFSRLLKELFKHPGILLRSGRMLQNSRIAADSAALAVITALQQGEPLIEPATIKTDSLSV